MKKIAIISTHPIQYNAPWFCRLAEVGLDAKVFYTWSQASIPQYDRGFGKIIEWDLKLTDGYEYDFIENSAKDPGIHHFNGIVNPTLIQKVLAFKPDAILVFGWNYKSHFTLMKYFKGKVPVLFRGDSTLLDSRGFLKDTLRNIFLRRVYRNIDKALFVGEANRAYFSKYGLADSQLVWAPHAIDNDRFSDLENRYSEQAKLWRKRLNYNDDDFVLLFAGKFEYKKNPFYLLELAKSLPEPNFKFLFVGNGELEASLKLQASSDQRIQFLPFQNQELMPVVYRLGNAFILPSVGPGETWGLAVNEAMVSGLPVIVSRKAGCSFDLIQKESGLRFDPADIDTVVNFIRKLYSNTSFYEYQRENALSIISKYSFDNLLSAVATAV